MKRLPPSATMREELDKLLRGGTEAEGNIVSALVEKVTKVVVQELLEAEQADFLGRGAATSVAALASTATATVMSGGASAPPRGL
jgi:hypothetical protein